MSNSLAATASKRLDTSDVKEDMQKLMNEAVGIVHEQANRVEQDFLAPVYAWYQDNARRYPTTTVFLTVFSLLSLLPVATFLAFSTVVFSTFVFGAVAAAVIAAGSVCAVAGSILLFILSFLLGAAIFITSSYVTALLAYRLWFHVFDKEGRGVEAWLRESVSRFGLAQTEGHRAGTSLVLSRKAGPVGGSGVVSDRDITVEDSRAKDVKVEDNSSTDEWSSVDKSQVGEVPEITKQFVNKPEFDDGVVSPGVQERLISAV